MKKMFICLVGMVMAISLAGCGGQSDAQNGGSAPDSSYTSAVQVLETVIDTYTEEQKFPIGGGDSENLTSEVPGAFDISKTEELDMTLGLPESEAANIDDAASMVHMMNANTFTGAAYRLKSGVQVEEFSEAVKENVLAKQWMCGFPDKLVIATLGNYVVSVYGDEELVNTFRDKLQAAYSDAAIAYDEMIGEGEFSDGEDTALEAPVA